MPTAEDVERACSEASRRSIAESEKQGAIVDPTYYDLPVRNPVCRPEPDSVSTLNCRFEQATIDIAFPTAEQRREALKRMRPSDWEPWQARLVYLAGAGWSAPQECQPVARPAAA
jgi:hypothetical protein